MKLILIIAFQLFIATISYGQTFLLKGNVKADGKSKSNVTVRLANSRTTKTDEFGHFGFVNAAAGKAKISLSLAGYKTITQTLEISSDTLLLFNLEPRQEELQEVVISGTFKEVNRLESPVPVEIYTAKFFQKNPTPSLFDALQNINGIRPQLNCNICNTGDIHINGLEGPYTMVTIDGMPMVSSLSTVYGLSGIPNSLVDRIEVVKGPASSLYGSEAVGGLINVITKSVKQAPLFSADFMTTSYLENNLDIGFVSKLNHKLQILTGVNYFSYNNKVDDNLDGFTDVTLQNRVSVFQKWNFNRKSNRLFSVAGRYLYEDRWGGEMNWTKQNRGGNDVYGESIYTKRLELFGKYQLPVKEKIYLSFSATNHNQDSRYGTTSYIAKQNIVFSQLVWDKSLHNHDLLFGVGQRYTYYDDNTVATVADNSVNKPEKVFLPSLFVQDQINFSEAQSLLLGVRYDYSKVHGDVVTPRLAYKYNFNANSVVRFNLGTGYRVVNVFTEDHAALTGARNVVIADNLDPEKSYNASLSFLKRSYLNTGAVISADVSAFYTHFRNRIIADYLSNSNEIRYENLKGYALTRGLSLNVDANFPFGLKVNLGATVQDVSLKNNGIKSKQLLTEKFMGTWAVSYSLPKLKLDFDYTGSIYGPMQLPLLNELDPRKGKSPVWSLQNIQIVYKGFKQLEFYGGVKNLLNFKPTKGNPFLIARTNDPFDRQVDFDASGNAKVTSQNPYGLTFDPTYVYAPNQGLRGFFGIRYRVN